MEDDLNSSFKDELNNSITFVNKPKRIRRLIPGVCKYCGKWFADGRNLYAHVRIHTGEKPFVCDVCHKAFNQSSNYRRHLVVHNPAVRKPFTCNICERQFLDKQYFEEHLRAHEGIKPYSCPICSKKFSHRASLRRHLPTHEKCPKSYTCRICEKSFAFEQLLNYHMRIHSIHNKGGQFFECTLCKRVFSRSGHFHNHLMRKHNIKVAFQCNTCNRRFPDKRALEIHYLNHRVNKCSAISQEKSETENELWQCFEYDTTKNSDLSNKYFQDEKHYINHKVDKISEASRDKLEIRIDSVQGFENGIMENSDLTEDFEDLHEEHEILPIENFETDFTENEQLPEVSSASQFEFEEIEIEPELDFNDSTTNSRYFCGMCYEEISSNINIQEHLRTHTQQNIFVCSKCKNCFDSKSLLEQHTCFSDNDAELFECYICEETFPSKENLKKHLFKHTEDSNS